MNKESVRKYLKRANFVPSKRMGQNFLVDKSMQQKIATAILPHDDTLILEIGPGLGAITKHLLEEFPNNDYVGVELDKRLFSNLKEQFSSKPNFHLLNADFLDLDFNSALINLKLENNGSIHLIANLPYSITSPILQKVAFISAITNCVIMVQKEFADRLCAKPRTKLYNAFTVMMQLVYECKTLFDVGPENFVPQPNVESSVIHLIRRNITNDKVHFSFLKQCFSNRRKTLYNNLVSAGYDQSQVEVFLKNNDLPKTVRAEELEPNTFLQLDEWLNDKK